MFSVSLSSSFVSSSSLIKSSSHRGRTNRSPIRDGGITTKAADVTREEGNDVLVRQQRRHKRGREAQREEERATTNNKTRRSRREVLKILPHTSGVALVVATAIGGFTAHPSFAAEKLSSVEEKELAKERRKAAVRAAAERAKETGVGGNAFSDSEYMVGEDHSPNAHSHQEEGSKGSFV
jgi:glutamate 5-kinase